MTSDSFKKIVKTASLGIPVSMSRLMPDSTAMLINGKIVVSEYRDPVVSKLVYRGRRRVCSTRRSKTKRTRRESKVLYGLKGFARDVERYNRKAARDASL